MTTRFTSIAWDQVTMIRRLRSILQNCLTVIAAIVFCEVGLQVAARFSEPVDFATLPPVSRGANPMILPGEDGIMRGNPDYPSHDQNGFRNSVVPDRATIVTLGDSHTYGTSVLREEAWPALLSQELGVGVYNMGLGSYGSLANALQLDMALSFQPKLIIFGFYFGNDLIDDFRLSNALGTLEAIVGPKAAQEAQALREAKSLEQTLPRLFGREKTEEQDQKSTIGSQLRAVLGPFAPIVVWLRENSRVLGLVRAIVRLTKVSLRGPPKPNIKSGDYAAAISGIHDKNRAYVSPFEGGDWRTILTGPYRLIVENLDDARVRAGLQVSKATLATMAEQLQNEGIEFIVVLFPPKEFVLWPRVEQPENHPGLIQLHDNELRIRQELKENLASIDVTLVDPLEALRRSQAQSYFENADGHPNSLGHQIIMQELARTLSNSLATK
jgi:lysophospholipase L1-like esterase